MHVLYVSSSSTSATLYVNGSSVKTFTTANRFNVAGATHYIGARNGPAEHLDGYLSNVYFVDGQALTPESFGRFNAYGQWVPKQYGGTYGNNGFYLPFTDNTSTTTLCYDQSGRGNHWTPSGISLTAGPTYDWMLDHPTNNYATLNPLDYYSASSGITFSEGNMKLVSNSNADIWPGKGSAMPFATYSEHTVVGTPTTNSAIGIYQLNQNVHGGASANICGYNATSYSCKFTDGSKFNNNVTTAYGSAFSAGDVMMMAFDPVAGKIWWGKNGTWFGSGDPAAGTNAAFTGITGDKQFGYNIYPTTSGFQSNFGQRPFAYTPPVGFKALCARNLAP
jgi:hypothetical protein